VERDANYTAVGAFVLLVLALGSAFVYWYSDSRDARDYTRYEIYFRGSVSGLSVGGPVRYLGVDVGRVVRVRVDKRTGDRVQVVADVDSEAPISQLTLAQLSLQGVTGLLFIDLQQAGDRKQAMAAVPSERYPVINSVRSDFDQFLSSLPDLTGRVRELIARVQDVFSETNVTAITNTLASLDRTTKGLPQTMQQFDGLVTELRATAGELRGVAANVRSTTDTVGPDLSDAIAKVRTTADNIAKATAQLDQVLMENRGGLRNFTNEALPELERTLRETRAAAQDFRELSRALRDNPSRILYQPAYHGVEIPK
jgi:phospholipid/cholesterol/gamma-HCH transport system substrate-binding protein